MSSSVRAVLYLRESVEDTDGIDRHRADCQRIAASKGWTIAREYVDDGIGASDAKKNRPAYRQMFDDYGAGQYDALLCWDLDRLTRIPRQLEDWLDAAEHRGLAVITANGEADLTTDAGRLFARVKIAVGRSEIERKSARRVIANRQRAERGIPPKGVRLTGYTVAGEIVPDEASVIEQIFKRFDTGDSLKGIARWLSETGVPTRRGGGWSPSSVSSILTNARYCGRLVYRPVKGDAEQHAGAWKPIIDEAMFDRVQDRMADPRRKLNKVGTDRKYLGGGLYQCGICERRVRTFSGYRYRCPDGHLIRAGGLIDKMVLTTVRDVLAQPDLADLIHQSDDEVIAVLSNEITVVRERIERTEVDYDNDLIDGRRFKIKIDKLRAELNSKLARRSRLSGAGLTLLNEDDPVAALDAAPLGVLRETIDALLDVRLYPAPRGRKGLDPATIKITSNLS